MECYFCQRNIKDIDFKETQILRRFISASGKIKPKKRTGVCSGHQRKLTRVIKRARYLALLSAISK
ncbi:MAG: 30S ribosomal protein S18 [Candidatus Nealsonbacteria bacterium CG23_combo_of_CG06-09_8_20_14_all_37_18]|uniref:Small ribosomal subunit protein bS18 n=1 Tax=Candidatus Nealsonbacteria bacterium CG23_combo_of_CG06-09_8_20_14_all_37_18 TaxID=1974720 RepID=A0A2G9YYU7_9BACT|nr:MAG: 30S ribosomal protein S18 [Candidatus Nealsonbacteria bacterium CG23_combo_of_CG06-09_8_20_14_all_37_18]